MSAARGWALGLTTVTLALASPPARAAPCGSPVILDTVPPDNAVDVPPNASLLAHYDISAEYGDEAVVLTRPDGSEVDVTGADPAKGLKFDATQGLLTYAPPEPLAAGVYVLTWPALRGLTAVRGLGKSVHFTVGAVADQAPPAFEGVTGVTWDLERKNNNCTESIEERFIFDLALGPADDDGGRANLTLVVFQTAGPPVDAGPIPVLTRAMPAPGARARVSLPVGDAVGNVCFAALARDLTAKVSNSGSREVCVHTAAPPFFHGCGMAAPAWRDREPAAAGAALALGLACLLSLSRGRPRRDS